MGFAVWLRSENPTATLLKPIGNIDIDMCHSGYYHCYYILVVITVIIIWRDRKLGLPIKIWLYTSIVKAILLYSAETWPLTKTETQRIEAANHKWLRRILNVSWTDVVRNESTREQTGQEKMELSVQKRRLRWLGHVQRLIK